MMTRHMLRTRPALTPIRLALLFVGIAAAGLTAEGQRQGRQPTGSAATAPSLAGILQELATYDGGIESAATWKLRDYVKARMDDPAGRAECEAALLRFLGSTATPPAKRAASRQLRVVAGDTAVPVLTGMLNDPQLVDLAVYSLQQIPGAAAEQALVQALSTTKGASRIAVVAALGEQRSTAAVPAIVPLLKQPPIASAAATALGRIGGDAAVAALAAARSGAPAPLASTIASALLVSAEQHLDAKNPTAALQLYEPLAADTTLPSPIRRAAVMGKIVASGSPAVLLEHLASPEPILQNAAIARMSVVIPADGIGPVCALLPRLPEHTQVQLLAILQGYPPERVRPAVLEAARSTAPAVRLAALNALSSVGDQSDVLFLAEASAGAKGQEQTVARAALAALKGPGVNDAIVAALGRQAPDHVKGELMIAASDRRIFTAKPLVTASLASPSGTLRLQALRSLRAIGTPSDTARVLDLLLTTGIDRERTEAERTVASLATKEPNADARARVVRARLADVKDTESRIRLIALLPMIGDNSALPVLRMTLNDPDAEVHDAAVRALVAWPSSAAKDDVRHLARDSTNETHRLLAIDGLVRLIGLETYREPRAAVADLREAAGFAWRPEEQKLVLGALPKFPCEDALELAASFLREASVKAEAQAAIDRIKPRLPKGKGSK
jgi:HEAT repeat protein